MSANYIFRIDDVSWDMDFIAFLKVKDMLVKYGVKPIIGVIPSNSDTKLKAQAGKNGIGESEFWHEIQHLHNDLGWPVALHGYNHVYTTSDSGLLKVNNRSEFAGLNYDIQYEKIRKGKQILKSHNISISAFMAPAHSFDLNTVKALQANGIYTITDGRTMFPYRKFGSLFMPQLFGKPFYMICGTYTICIHTNTINEKTFNYIESFISKHRRSCLDFDTAVEKAKINAFTQIMNGLTYYLFAAYKNICSILYKIRQKKIQEG